MPESDAMTGEQPAEPEDSEIAWGELWDAQYGFCRELDTSMEKRTAGRSDAYRAALLTYLIEHLSEQLRMCLRLPEADVRARDGDDG